ncbi:MAG: tetratricopeptide repeat protein [Proteobacteria bacterium]|nr:tetratricopeptide repeat protein [Pseudomonadota bacterium]
MKTDRRGLPLTTGSDDAVAHLDAAVEEFVGFKPEPMAHVKRALAADPGFVMAHCLRGCFFLMMGVPAVRPKAAQHLAAAQAGEATPREQAHVAALGAWLAGDLTGAVRRWDDILVDHPTDLLALRLAHGFYFDLGDRQNLRDSAARALPAWDADLPGYGYVLGMHAFGLEECGDYAAAESAGRRAVEIDPEDIWSVHAVAHVMEMQGRQRDGIDWLSGLEPHWTKCNFFVHHVWWHQALFHLERDQRDAALAIYDQRVRDDFSEIVYDMIDAASLLWRLELYGVDVGGRWAELADKSEARVGDHIDAFSDAHFMMCLAGAGRGDAAENLVGSMGEYAATHDVTMAPIMREVGVAACEALAAFRAGEYGRAVELLLPVRYALHRIGGSHAQRDLFAQMLIVAALRDGRFALARALLAERTALKPASAPSWRWTAEALDGLGEQSAAADARAQAEAVLAS